MEMEKSKILMQFLVIFRQFGDFLSFLYARRLRGCTATDTVQSLKSDLQFFNVDLIHIFAALALLSDFVY